MLPQCIQAVQAAAKAAGRKPLTKAELKKIDDELDAKQRHLARTDPNWQALTRDQRWAAASQAVLADIQNAAQRAQDNAMRQIVVQAQVANRLAVIKAATKGASDADVLKRDYSNTNNIIRQIRNAATAKIMDTIEAALDKTGAGIGRKALMMLFDAENPVMTRDLVREIYAGASGVTGNTAAKAGARAWLDTIEQLRKRFNAAGGDVGKVDYGWLPRSWDAEIVRRAGADKWARDLMPHVDRTRMLREDGSQLTDPELLDVLRTAWKTVSTEGVIHQVPGQFKGSGKRANRGNEHRVLHFKDGEADLAVRAMYGRGSVFDAMTGHISAMARDIGLVERYGPDPNATAGLRMDLIAEAAGKPLNKAVGLFEIHPQTYWDILTGKTATPHSERMANIGQTARNIQVFGKLGGAVISSLTDAATVAITTGYNRMSFWEVLRDVGAQAKSAEAREWLSTQGIVAESLANGLDRWSGDFLGQNWSGKLANATMKLSLMNRWTDSMRQGFNMALSHKLADMAKKGWQQLDEFDRARLQRAGITEADWQVLQQTAPAQRGGREFLTPAAVKDQAVSDKLGAFIMDEGEFAVVNPDIRTRSIITHGGQQAGTPGGELARTVMQFKSFPIALISRHWGRMLEGTQGLDGAPLLANRAAYGFALLASLTALGAMVTQTKHVLQGKDPVDMTGEHAGRFWMRAMAQGGGWGILGDLFLLDPQNSVGGTAATFSKNLAGPTIGTATEILITDIAENVWQAADGKDTHAGAEIARTMQGLTPGVGVWWIRPFVEHGVTHALQENMSPGYLSRMRDRARKDWGQRYWWAPGKTEPDRAPDVAGAFGQ